MKNTKHIPEFLKTFNPSKDNFLNIISSVTTDDMLEHIASADYGYGKEECYPILKEIRKSKIINNSNFHIIKEEISLIRWTYPKNEFEYTLVAFNNCIALIMEGLDNEYDFFCENGQLVGLIYSVSNLDKKYIMPALQLIAWRVLTDYQEELKSCKNQENRVILDIYLVFSLFLLSILNQESENKIEKTLKLLIETEKKYNSNNDIFIFNYGREPKHQFWKDVTKKILSNTGFIKDIILEKNINTIKDCVVNEKRMDQVLKEFDFTKRNKE